MLPPIKEPRKPLSIPRWLEWILVAVMLVLAYVEYAHGEIFWTIFFAVAALVVSLSAAGFFGRPNKEE